jgi:DNA polymerase III epsilon subunit-like protein
MILLPEAATLCRRSCRHAPNFVAQPRAFALDCEMCATSTSDRAPVSAVLVDQNGATVMDTLIQPEGDIVDMRTQIHGITEAQVKVRMPAL